MENNEEEPVLVPRPTGVPKAGCARKVSMTRCTRQLIGGHVQLSRNPNLGHL